MRNKIIHNSESIDRIIFDLIIIFVGFFVLTVWGVYKMEIIKVVFGVEVVISGFVKILLKNDKKWFPIVLIILGGMLPFWFIMISPVFTNKLPSILNVIQIFLAFLLPACFLIYSGVYLRKKQRFKGENTFYIEGRFSGSRLLHWINAAINISIFILVLAFWFPWEGRWEYVAIMLSIVSGVILAIALIVFTILKLDLTKVGVGRLLRYVGIGIFAFTFFILFTSDGAVNIEEASVFLVIAVILVIGGESLLENKDKWIFKDRKNKF